MTGVQNTAFGYEALESNTTGNYNTASGYGALYKYTTGSNNIAMGYQAGLNLTTPDQPHPRPVLGVVLGGIRHTATAFVGARKAA